VIIPAVETHLIPSRHVRQTFKVQVMLPARERGEEARFPVVYVTDGNFAFDVVRGLSYGLQRSVRDAPRFIVVGIGYPGESPFAGSLLRMRDFTFPGYPRFSTNVPGVPAVEQGAPDFLQFIRDELIPLIDGRYATIPGERTVFGHSGGGGFGLFALFTQSDVFRNYIISSPSLSYHGTSSAGIHYDNYDFMTEKVLASGPVLSGSRLYMSVGSEEEFEPALASWRLTSSFVRLAALMKARPIAGLELITEILPEETHMTVWPRAFIRGIQAVFRTGAWAGREP
jgi:uncharacterized protein